MTTFTKKMATNGLITRPDKLNLYYNKQDKNKITNPAHKKYE